MIADLYHLTPVSNNAKTGPIAVTTSHARTCPSICPFKKNGCYADSGPLALHWKKVTDGERGLEWPEFVRQIKQLERGRLLRHNQSGDLPGDGEKIDETKLRELALACDGLQAFTYTHYPVLPSNKRADTPAETTADSAKESNRRLLAEINATGAMCINLSGNSPSHADRLAELGIGPVVTVLPHTVEGRQTDLKTPAGRRIVVCPATYIEGKTCANCRLCSSFDREVIVGFPAHGAQHKRVDKAIAEAST